MRGKHFGSDLKAKKNMNEQISHCQSHLHNPRSLHKKLAINSQKLEATLENLRKIFVLSVRSRSTSTASRKKK